MIQEQRKFIINNMEGNNLMQMQQCEHRLQQLTEKLHMLSTEKTDILRKSNEFQAQAESALVQNQELQKEVFELKSEIEETQKQLTKVQGEAKMMESLGKLKQAMMDMKDKEIKTCKETIEMLKNQVQAVQSEKNQKVLSDEEKETLEYLKAQVHSLAYINKQQEITIQTLQSERNEALKQYDQQSIQMLNIQKENSSLESVRDGLEQQIAEFILKERELELLKQQFQDSQDAWRKERDELQVQLQAQKSINERENAMSKLQTAIKISGLERDLKIAQDECKKLSDEIKKVPEVDNSMKGVGDLLRELRASSDAYTKHQERELALTNEIVSLKKINHELSQKAKIADQVEEFKLSVQIMTDQVAEAHRVNEHLVKSYQAAREEACELRQKNKILEQANEVNNLQFRDFIKQSRQAADGQTDITQLLTTLSNRTYAAVCYYFQNNEKHHLNQENIQHEWKEMQKERAKEKKLMLKLIGQIKKVKAAKNSNGDQERVFKYMIDQLNNLRQLGKEQERYFTKLQEEVKIKQTPLNEKLSDQTLESLTTQITQLETQITTLTASHTSVTEHNTKLFQELSALKKEHDTLHNQLHAARKDLIQVTHEFNKQTDELYNARVQLKTERILSDARYEELSELQADYERLLEQGKIMSAIRDEYKLQGVNAQIQANIEKIKIQNQELMISEQGLKQKVHELEEKLRIFNEDYERLQDQVKISTERKDQDEEMKSAHEDHVRTTIETQTDFTSQLEQQVYETLLTSDSQLFTITEEVLSKYEELLAIFYAYSRSESKIDEKEVTFAQDLDQKNSELQDIKQKLDTASQLNTSLKDKLIEFQQKLTQQQQQQAQQAPSRVVMTQQQSQESQQRIAQLTREKQQIEQTMKQRISEFENQMRQQKQEQLIQARSMQQRNSEMAREIEKLRNQLGSAAPQIEGPPQVAPVLTKFMQSLHKARKIIERTQPTNE